ncbi:class I SAM-dependent methyltransferase [Terracidiphilus gabretensis]|uniref:class I SAM-dependent methyltransferase n=1 Tax=Terracidiphilus gabretensis TaxID=1577687 RepID=UPI00071B44FF|nr:class I SAM-dependent methyltransferase [Terracidiphilus gabretensis]
MLRWLDKRHGNQAATPSRGVTGPKVGRHSGGWTALRKRLEAEPGLRVLDTGFTSPTNINYLTNLGHSVYMADLVHDACTGDWKRGEDEDGKPVYDVNGFLDSSLSFSEKKFDIVLLWTTLDYLPEALVAAVVQRLADVMNPGGSVLALFHTRMQGEETVHCRFHVTPGDDVEMQLAEQFPIQRVFTNRSIEKLFAGWSGHRQFLAKDSLSEVIMTR